MVQEGAGAPLWMPTWRSVHDSKASMSPWAPIRRTAANRGPDALQPSLSEAAVPQASGNQILHQKKGNGENNPTWPIYPELTRLLYWLLRRKGIFETETKLLQKNQIIFSTSQMCDLRTSYSLLNICKKLDANAPK